MIILQACLASKTYATGIAILKIGNDFMLARKSHKQDLVFFSFVILDTKKSLSIGTWRLLA